MRKLILVDAADNALGTGEKLAVHRQGLLHRAFSLFLLDGSGRVLLQRRAEGKYHSGGLWTNACCSHPVPELPLSTFVALRAKEELGVTVTDLREMGHFLYYKDFGDGLKEFELDHVFVGRTQDVPRPDPEEVSETAWLTVPEAEADLCCHPERYTAWYPTAFAMALPALAAK